MKISIVTINYNNRVGLQKTIESVVGQTYRSIEYIVIDGGSTDGSADTIKYYGNAISYWISEPDKGIYNAMNKGVAKATGDYVLFLNSGDYLESPTVIDEIQQELVSNEDIIFGLLKCYPSGIVGYKEIQLPLTLLDFFDHSPIPHPAAFIKTELFQTLKYDESLKIVSDWKFFLETVALKGCRCKKINRIITIFEDDGLSSRNTVLCNDEREQVLKGLLPKAIYVDYFKFSTGMEYKTGNYESFFSRLRPYKYSQVIYVVSILMVRLISFFKKSARFARNYPLTD